MKLTDDMFAAIEITNVCVTCSNKFSATSSDMFIEKRRISNHRIVYLAHHATCYERAKKARGRLINKMKNPVGRYGARNGG